MAKKAKSLSKNKADRNWSQLVLDGEIAIEDYKNNKLLSREVIDGKVILEIILQALKMYMAEHPI